MPEELSENKKRLAEITAGIEKGIQDLWQSDRYKDYLRVMSRFHRYSVNNTMLIYMQNPNASLVAGFKKWEKNFGRHVKRGEKGIKIIAPAPHRKKVEEPKLDPDTKAPIDAAIQEWNGSIESKQAVVRYMTDHAREKGTAAWLKNEYGDDLPAFPVTSGAITTDIPWPKIQRRIAQLIAEDRFYTEEEQDRFDDIDPVAIREELERRQTQGTSPFVEMVMADVERIAEQEEQSPPAGDIEPPAPAFDPLAPAYKIGDTVYLNGTRYTITDILTDDVQLTDLSLEFLPIIRTEDRGSFNRLLRQDARNKAITDFLADEPGDVDGDLQDALIGDGGLINQTDKEYISIWIREGVGNAAIARRLAEMYAGTTETMMLQTGEGADFFATPAGLEIDISDKYDTKLSFRWDEIAPILRAMFIQERNGFSHTPVIADAEYPIQEEAPKPSAESTVQKIYEQYFPEVRDLVLADKAYINACKNSDQENAMLEGRAAVQRAAVSIDAPNFMRAFYDDTDFHDRLCDAVLDETYPALSQAAAEAERGPQMEPPPAPDISDRPITRQGDTISIGDGPATHEITATVTDDEWEQLQEAIPEQPAPAFDPLAPAYKVGDTVYLDDTLFEITAIGDFDVQLRDPTLYFPIFRAESRERFETLLRQDPRNGPITEFLAIDLKRFDDSLREVLIYGLLTDQDKDHISGWFRNGESNTRVAQRLSDLHDVKDQMVVLVSGKAAHYSTSTTGFSVETEEKRSPGMSISWNQAAMLLRTYYQQELGGFSHEPAAREPVRLEGEPDYHVGDHVTIPTPERDISGTIGYVGDESVRVDTGPYAWSGEVMDRGQFEQGLRQDERNAGLFTPEAEHTPPEAGRRSPEAEQKPPQRGYTTETVAVYPAEPNRMPFDVVIERISFDEPEHTPPQPPPQNFHITDDALGVGGPKAKFRANMEAITLLKELEFDGRQATPEEQEILSRYVGWGALADAFDENKPNWADEFKELYAVLSPEEYRAARASTLNAHYTSPTVIKAIYEALDRMGFQSGNVKDYAQK